MALLELSQALHRALGSHPGEQQQLQMTTLCVAGAKKWGGKAIGAKKSSIYSAAPNQLVHTDAASPKSC